MTTYVVTGSSGHLGRRVVEELLDRGVPAADVAVVRTPAKADELAGRGVQVRDGDYDRPDTLPAALDVVGAAGEGRTSAAPRADYAVAAAPRCWPTSRATPSTSGVIAH